MTIPAHHQDDRLLVRKICVGPLENNVYVVACAHTRKAVIIDAAAEPQRVVAAAADVEPVAILTTHGHHDHVGAVDEVRRRLGIPFRINAADAAKAGMPADIDFDDGDRIEVGKLAIEVRHTPGHTPGSCCFLVDGHLFSGDTLFPGGPGKTGTRDAFEQVMRSLQGLFTLPDDTIVHPGHGLDTTIGTERPSLPTWQARGY